MGKPLTSSQLDQMSCGSPGCDHSSHDGPLFIHASCHVGANVEVSYDRGYLDIACAACHKPVCTIQVASGY